MFIKIIGIIIFSIYIIIFILKYNYLFKKRKKNLGYYNTLIWASKNGDIEMVKEEIALGENINIQDEDGFTALIYAYYNGNMEVVVELIKYGANINIKDKYGKTALDYAKEEGYNDIVDFLME